MLLKLILSDGPQFLSTKRPFNAPTPAPHLGRNFHVPPLSPAWQLRPRATSPPGLSLRCARGLGGGFPVRTVDLRSECGWVLEGWEMS